jgi:hypothetical protein
MKSINSGMIAIGMVCAVVSIGNAQDANSPGSPAGSPAAGSNTTAAATAPAPTKSAVHFEGSDLHIGSLPPVAFHGFASQGFLYSGSYNYLGDTTDGSFRFSEFGLNASVNPLPRTRIAVQGFSYCVGDTGDYDAVLDYALAEYTFNDAFGVRAGRVRRPEGIYNDIQDVDLARTFVLLPQGMYNARWRDMYTTIDGGEFFGTIPLNKAGTLSYTLYAGLQRPQLDGGLALQKENMPPYQPIVRFNSPLISGGQLWWNTPLTGFRAGVALNYNHDLSFWFPGGVEGTGSPFVQHYSLEYVWNSWTFEAEYFTYNIWYAITAGGRQVATVPIEPDSWYLSAAYRFNHWLEVGTYYTQYYPDVRHRDGASYVAANGGFASDAHQDDAALAFRFDATPWWIIKVEGHLIEGTGQLYDQKANPVRHNNLWPMVAIKSTFCF